MAASASTATSSDTGTEARVAGLRKLAEIDPVGAQDAAWAWFERLGRLAGSDQDSADAQLAELFATGRPSQGLDGATDGILVAPMIHPALDAFARALTKVWMPWQGKRFNLAAQTGDNRMVNSFGVVGRLFWPRYSSRTTDGGRLAFDFTTRVEAGGIEPAVDVFVIDYEPVDANPNFVIRRIRDELVEIVPGTHLGRILYRTKNGYDNWGYFALRTEVA
jgi:hypothetical protein